MLLKARYNAIRKETGQMTDPNEFASKEAFDDIEHQYNVFKKFFKTEWKNVKKHIRKDVFDGFSQEVKDTLAKKSDKVEEQKKKEDTIAEELVAVTEAEELVNELCNEESKSDTEKALDDGVAENESLLKMLEGVNQEQMQDDLANVQEVTDFNEECKEENIEQIEELEKVGAQENITVEAVEENEET